MGRALYYSRYTKKAVWKVGFILYILTMAEAFLAATVLTAIAESVPVVGPTLFKYLVGGFSVTNVTLVRVFSAHVCLGFVILGLMVLHLFYLHSSGSKNPLFSSFGYGDVVYFHSYFTTKDFFCLGYLESDPLVTPVSIKPEWYFLVYYAMLRSVDSKIGGLVLVVSLLFFLWVPTFKNSRSYFVLRQIAFWIIVCLFVGLTYLGSCHPEYPYLGICQLFSFSIVLVMFTYKLFWSKFSTSLGRLIS
ncbi:unnamed protein product [Schistocephalus solidus]|uniref:Cytochrome b n=1 Tax=Schistocephalus solidus TaxID=70667 RepID=A0A183SA07_SCHSO|nr:unnamed protein product [Schistocephalus solidus]